MVRSYNHNRAPAPLRVGDLLYYLNHPVTHDGRQITAKLLHGSNGPCKFQKFLTPVKLGYDLSRVIL